ncbi:MAG: aldo/keto reductase [Erysipelothrix sp.]|nr:aldo/keto reductase [Erysipelothrix sp.]
MINTDYKLNNGILIPSIGFGTWQIPDGQEAYQSTLWALQNGYRHIDTAYVYRNEVSVGQAIKDSGIDRHDIFVTTKLSANIKDATLVREYFLKSLENLGLDYIDLYIIHNARPWTDRIEGYDYFEENVKVYKELEKLYEEGLVRSIGVSNFNVKDLENLLAFARYIPVLNQIKFHPGYLQKEIVEYCETHQILVEAYSPFATGKIFGNDVLRELSQKYSKTEAQIIMRWILQIGHLPLPKSVHEDRIISNLDVFDFKLTDDDIKKMNAIEL